MDWPALATALLVVLNVAVAGVVAADADADPFSTALDPLGRDSDGDGFLDTPERALGTDPLAVDTDGDGLRDPHELDGPTDPSTADTDADGLSDGREVEMSTDPLASDTDTDGLRDGREVALGTDPTVADSDGDTVADGTEVAGETDPRSSDTDGDGLRDGREPDLGTDPAVADTDGDGLADGREVELGTDPLDDDTDGDRLLDGWEVAGESADGAPLPDADPLRMDLYVELLRPEGADRLTAREQATLERYWAEMPVENPDGSTGIAIHVRRQTVAGEVVHVHGDDDRDARDYYDERYLGNRTGEYHLAVLTSEYEYGGSAAFGTAPGRVSVYARWPGFRADVLTHELLHNVVGRLHGPLALEDDPYHASEGFLTPRGAEPYLPASLAERLSEEGFAD